MKSSHFRESFVGLLILALSACSPKGESLEGVQLWEGGPYWATENLTAPNGSHQLTFDEALGAEGHGWRVPTEEDYLALKENCEWRWVEGDGVADGYGRKGSKSPNAKASLPGFEVTGPTGAKLFFPAEGYASRNITRKYDGILGFYWTSTPAANQSQAREVYMDENYAGINDRGRDNGLSVRMVCDNYAPVMAEVQPCLSYTGRGNTGETLFTIKLVGARKFRLEPIQLTLDAPEGVVEAVRLVDKGSGKVLAGSSAQYGTVVFHTDKKFRGEATLEVCVDVAEDAAVGSVIKASLQGGICARIGSSDVISVPVTGSKCAEREVLLSRKCLYRPGDYGSNFWRIPAIRQLSDGTLLAVNDRRNDTEDDLPGRIDVVYRYSTDGGRSWSEPGFIAKNGGYLHGYGDPSLVECEDGTVICMFCGAQTFTMSNLQDPQRSFYAVSYDHGRTWTDPVEITSLMWGPACVSPSTVDCTSSFFSSGNSLRLASGPHKGRILVASVMHHEGMPGLQNHAVWSDDNGATWHVSSLAFDHGDEAKMVELSDGRILMSIRQNGDRAYVISEDGGETWGSAGVWPEMHVTACNGDLIRYCWGAGAASCSSVGLGSNAGISVGSGAGILLQTVPDSMTRENVTVYVSFDDGATWPVKKCICHGPSQYSSLAILPDGTIAAYIEENTKGTELWFETFSLEWLLSQ